MKNLILVNPTAYGGRARNLFASIESDVRAFLGDYRLAVTSGRGDIVAFIEQAIQSDAERIIVIGGDGTAHALANAVMSFPRLHVPIGFIPCGTGRDWVRSLGTPHDPKEAIAWLARAAPTPCDIGMVEHSHGNTNSTEYFINMTSTGIGGEVDARVNRSARRTNLTFLSAIVRTILTYRSHEIIIECDGETILKGPCYTVILANGRFFGHGIRIAPRAIIDDGLLDVVIIGHMTTLQALYRLLFYHRGTHLKRKEVQHFRASEVVIRSQGDPLNLDIDGEYVQASTLRCAILRHRINVLMDTAHAPLERNVQREIR